MSFAIVLCWTIFYGLVAWIFFIFSFGVLARISKKYWLEPDRVLRKSAKFFKKSFIWIYRKVIKTPEERQEKERKKREGKFTKLFAEEGKDWEKIKFEIAREEIKEKIEGEVLEDFKRAKILTEAREAKKKRDIVKALNVRLNDISKISSEYPDITRENIKKFAERNPKFIEVLNEFNVVDSKESELKPEVEDSIESQLTVSMGKILDLFNQNKGKFVLIMKTLESHDDFIELFKEIKNYSIEATDRYNTQQIVEALRPKKEKLKEEDELLKRKSQERRSIVKKSGSPACIKETVYKYDFLGDVTEEAVEKLMGNIHLLRAEKWIKEAEGLLKQLKQFHPDKIDLEKAKEIFKKDREKAKTDKRIKNKKS